MNGTEKIEGKKTATTTPVSKKRKQKADDDQEALDEPVDAKRATGRAAGLGGGSVAPLPPRPIQISRRSRHRSTAVTDCGWRHYTTTQVDWWALDFRERYQDQQC